MSRIFKLLIVIYFVSTVDIGVLAQQVSIATNLTSKLNCSDSWKITISTKALDKKIDTQMSWGSEPGIIPKNSLNLLKIEYKGQILINGYSGTPKLFNLSKIEMDCSDTSKLILKISGGDAGTSYVASFTYDKEQLLSRHIYSGEFPDEVWEKTTYSSVNKLEN